MIYDNKLLFLIFYVFAIALHFKFGPVTSFAYKMVGATLVSLVTLTLTAMLLFLCAVISSVEIRTKFKVARTKSDFKILNDMIYKKYL